jgi:putative membrane protein
LAARRFPDAVYRNGDEADARFSLANERTFLAWIRTSLALIAAAIALEALKLPIRPDFRIFAAWVFVALGVVAPVHAWISWMRTEKAMRLRRPLPAPALSGVLAVGVFGAGVVIAVGMLAL